MSLSAPVSLCLHVSACLCLYVSVWMSVCRSPDSNSIRSRLGKYVADQLESGLEFYDVVLDDNMLLSSLLMQRQTVPIVKVRFTSESHSEEFDRKNISSSSIYIALLESRGAPDLGQCLR